MDKNTPKVEFEKGFFKNGGSTAMTWPKELLDYLDVEYDNKGIPKTTIRLIGDVNKAGMPFVGIWNPKQQKKETE